jgi:outer membrane murein-binding lipoprotein Lpp
MKKLSRLILALAIIALLAGNSYQIYQSNRVKVKIDKLQTNVTSLQKQVKAVNGNVSNTDSDVQTLCGNFTTFSCY